MTENQHGTPLASPCLWLANTLYASAPSPSWLPLSVEFPESEVEGSPELLLLFSVVAGESPELLLLFSVVVFAGESPEPLLLFSVVVGELPLFDGLPLLLGLPLSSMVVVVGEGELPLLLGSFSLPLFSEVLVLVVVVVVVAGELPLFSVLPSLYGSFWLPLSSVLPLLLGSFWLPLLLPLSEVLLLVVVVVVVVVGSWLPLLSPEPLPLS